MCVSLKIRWLSKLFRDSREFRGHGIFHDIAVNFSTSVHILARTHNRIFILPKEYAYNVENVVIVLYNIFDFY